jgi:hypothetical protein
VFEETLIEQLLDWEPPSTRDPPTTRTSLLHHKDDMGSVGFRAYSKEHRSECYQGMKLPKKDEKVALGVVVNEARIKHKIDDSATWKTARPSRVRTGCKTCNVHLCTSRDCWQAYHGLN